MKFSMLVTIKLIDAQQSHLCVTNRSGGAENQREGSSVSTTGGETPGVSRSSWVAQPAPRPSYAVACDWAPSITVNNQRPLPRPAAKSRGLTTVDRSPQAGTVRDRCLTGRIFLLRACKPWFSAQSFDCAAAFVAQRRTSCRAVKGLTR